MLPPGHSETELAEGADTLLRGVSSGESNLTQLKTVSGRQQTEIASLASQATQLAPSPQATQLSEAREPTGGMAPKTMLPSSEPKTRLANSPGAKTMLSPPPSSGKPSSPESQPPGVEKGEGEGRWQEEVKTLLEEIRDALKEKNTDKKTSDKDERAPRESSTGKVDVWNMLPAAAGAAMGGFEIGRQAAIDSRK